MRLNRKTGKKLASLSALGASAVALTAGKAEAGIIYTALSSNNKVGFDTGYSANYTSPALNGLGSFQFFTNSFSTYSSRPNQFGRSVIGTGNGLVFAGFSGYSTPGEIALFGKGAKFNSTSSTVVGGRLLRRSWNSSGARADANFTDQYALFRFGTGLNPLYGWVELSGSVNNDMGVNPGDGPDLTIEGFAYDDSGAKIAAGDTGAPEPSTFALSGLAALVLGASALRRWRAARQA